MLTVVLGIILVVILLGLFLPPCLFSHGINSRRLALASRMRQVMFALNAYAAEDETKPAGRYPRDLATLMAWSDGEITPALMKAPGRPKIDPAFVYIRPAPSAKATTLVLVANPACADGKGSTVVYADGLAKFLPGTALWLEACRLAQSPKAWDGGIERSDWAASSSPPQDH